MLDFIDRVTRGSRPKRPQGDQKPAIPDEIWDLAVRSWAHEPDARPTANTVRDKVNFILQLASVERRAASQGKFRDEIRVLHQDMAKLREKGEVKDQELLQLRADLSLVTQTHNQCSQTAREARLQGEAKDRELQQSREELSSMKKRMEAVEEALRKSEARCQELQKSQDLLSSVAEVLGKRIREAQVARREAEAKDREVQDIQEQFLSFAEKHSNVVKPEEQRLPAKSDAMLDSQGKPDSDRKDRDPSLPPSKAPFFAHPPDEEVDIPFDGRHTIRPIEKPRRNIDDHTDPPVRLPHTAEPLWHLNPWHDDDRHDGPTEEERHDRSAVAKATPEPRSLTGLGVDGDGDVRRQPDHHEIETIQTTGEPYAGPAGPRHVQNLQGWKYTSVSPVSRCLIPSLLAQQNIQRHRKKMTRRDWVMWCHYWQLLRQQSST
jgi:predicted  nucleic acid-binding Zn-ribbon protein